MFARSLALLGLGVALTLASPVAISLAQTKPDTVTTDAKKPVVLKKKKTASAASQKASPKKVAKANAKPVKTAKTNAKSKTKKPATEEVAEQPRRSLFATLFGGGLKPADDSSKTKLVRPGKPAPQIADASKIRPLRKPSAPLEPVPVIEPVAMTPEVSEVVAGGNNGELRSGDPVSGGIIASIFGDEDAMLPQTRALDNQLRKKEMKKSFKVAPQWQPQEVAFSGYPRGTIVIDTSNHFLYLVESSGTARRYGIAVGKEGLQYKGNVKVGDKQEWPRWIPTKEMQEREPKKYGQYKDGMPGGGMNPLGARAIYLYDGRQDTHLRIHGTIAPQSIGTNASNGCFRMINDHVIDLYRRVPIGANVVVL